MNLRGLNLNLLVVFDAMMRERSTTKAGRALSLSQSAISNSIAQLRLLLDDPLFVRVKNEMVPTPRAVALATPIREALSSVRSAVGQIEQFVPADSDRTFRLGLTDYVCFVLLGEIINQVRLRSDGIKLRVRSITAENLTSFLDNDEADLCIGFSETMESWHQSHVLFHDDWVCARKRVPGRPQSITLDEYLSASHVVVGDRLSNHIDRMLKDAGHVRKGVVSLPYCLAAPALLRESDLLLTMPRRLAMEFGTLRDIETVALPFATKAFPVTMSWHSRNERDEAISWLRNAICSAAVEPLITKVA